MVNIEYDQIDIDEKVEMGQGQWYAHAGFGIKETQKQLGLFKKVVTYNETLFLLITSEGIEMQSGPKSISADEFDRRLVLKEFDEGAIIKYIGKKVAEATKEETIVKAFEYLEKFFTVDEWFLTPITL